MNQQDKLELLKLAFRCVGLGFTDEQVELISLTSESMHKKKGNFNLRDAAIIQAELYKKYHSENETEFDELEQIETYRE